MKCSAVVIIFLNKVIEIFINNVFFLQIPYIDPILTIPIYLLKFAEVNAFLFQPQLCRTFYSNNLHNIVGSVLSVTLMALFGGI